MSTTLYVWGIKPPDEKWLKMKAAYDACKAADVEFPYFFGDEPAADQGVVVPLGNLPIGYGKVVSNHASLQAIFNVEDSGRFIINLDDLPEDVTQIKFSVS